MITNKSNRSFICDKLNKPENRILSIDSWKLTELWHVGVHHTSDFRNSLYGQWREKSSKAAVQNVRFCCGRIPRIRTFGFNISTSGHRFPIEFSVLSIERPLRIYVTEISSDITPRCHKAPLSLFLYIYIRQWKSRVISGGRRTRSRTIFFSSIAKLARLERSDTPFDDQAMQLMHFLLYRLSRRALYTSLFNPERTIGGGPFSFIEIQSPVSWTIANLKVFPSLMSVSANYSYNTIHSSERSR